MFGGVPLEDNKKELKSDQKPHIIVGTPGRILDLSSTLLKFNNLKYFVVDECDRVLSNMQMRLK